MTAIEHKELKGVTARIIVLIIVSTISICTSIGGVYMGLHDQIGDNNTETKLLELRLRIAESRIVLIENDLRDLKKSK